MYNRSIEIASLTETTRKRTPAMKHTLQLFAYRLLTLWHHGLIRLYQLWGKLWLLPGLPAPDSFRSRRLLSLCRKLNRHLCLAMRCSHHQKRLIMALQ